MEPVDFEGDGELHGIVSSEPMPAGRQHRLAEESGGQFNDSITLDQMATEVTEDGPALGRGEVAGMLSAGDRGSDFDGGDAGDIEAVAAAFGTAQGISPKVLPVSFTWLTFDHERTGIEEIIGHFNDAHG